MRPTRTLILCSLLAACGGSHAASRATPPTAMAKTTPPVKATPVAKTTPPPAAERTLITESGSDIESTPDVMVGTLVSVGRAPGFWSGGMMAIQELTYDVTEVLRGPAATGSLTVRWVIVASSDLVAGTPALRPELTQVGTRYLLAVADIKGYGRMGTDVVPATPARISALKAKLTAP